MDACVVGNYDNHLDSRIPLVYSKNNKKAGNIIRHGVPCERLQSR